MHDWSNRRAKQCLHLSLLVRAEVNESGDASESRYANSCLLPTELNGFTFSVCIHFFDFVWLFEVVCHFSLFPPIFLVAKMHQKILFLALFVTLWNVCSAQVYLRRAPLLVRPHPRRPRVPPLVTLHYLNGTCVVDLLTKIPELMMIIKLISFSFYGSHSCNPDQAEKTRPRSSAYGQH